MTNANTLLETSLLYTPTSEVLAGYNFLIQSTSNKSGYKVSRIEGLPEEKVLIDDELSDFEALIEDPVLFRERGYSFDGEFGTLLTAEGETLLGKSVMAGQQSVYMPWLYSDEERAATAQLATNAFKKFMSCNIGLVVSAADTFRHHIDQDEAVQYGTEGLARAVVKFDYREGVKFSTYGYRWIHQSIQLRTGHVRPGMLGEIPRGLVRDIKVVDKKRTAADKVLSDEEVAKTLGWKVDRVAAAATAKSVKRLTLSFGSPMLLGESKVYGDYIPDQNAVDPAEAVTFADILPLFRGALDKLEEPLRTVAAEDIFIPALDSAKMTPTQTRVEGLSPAFRERLRRTARNLFLHPSLGVIQKAHPEPEAEVFIDAPCVDTKYTTFFTSYSVRSDMRAARKYMCGSCPVRKECIEWAVKNSVVAGFWGGQSMSHNSVRARMLEQEADDATMSA